MEDKQIGAFRSLAERHEFVVIRDSKAANALIANMAKLTKDLLSMPNGLQSLLGLTSASNIFVAGWASMNIAW